MHKFCIKQRETYTNEKWIKTSGSLVVFLRVLVDSGRLVQVIQKNNKIFLPAGKLVPFSHLRITNAMQDNINGRLGKTNNSRF